MTTANPLGLAVGSLVPGLIVGDTKPKRLDEYLIFQCVFAALVCLSTFFVQSHPPTAPSATAAYRVRNANIVRDVKTLMNNFGFLTLCNIFSLSVGAVTALLTLMEQLLRPQGYTDSDAGIISAALIFAGILGCGALGASLWHACTLC
jgi:MFS transporter, FLVCR family, MFS-domain-containing protein 7